MPAGLVEPLESHVATQHIFTEPNHCKAFNFDNSITNTVQKIMFLGISELW